MESEKPEKPAKPRKQKQGKKRNSAKKLKRRIIVILILVLVLIIGILALVLYLRYGGPEPEPSLSSTLMEALDIDELSTSSFIYNGIAEIYDSEKEKVLYNIRYDSTVKAGIQMHDIRIEEDAEQKILKITLPEITIQSVTVDSSQIDFLPEDADIELQQVLSTCRQDARNEAEKDGRLKEAAQENLQAVIEALTLPLIEDTDYRLEW